MRTFSGQCWALIIALGASACARATHAPQAVASASPRVCTGRAVGSDAELVRFKGCAELHGDLTVAGNVTTLAPLGSMSSVWGTLAIDSTESLRSLEGLEGLRGVSRLIVRNNPELASLRALRNLRAVRAISIVGNPALRDLKGLDGVLAVEELTIARNGIYTLHGLGNVYSMGELVLSDNPHLYNAHGLSGIIQVARVVIANNPRLSGRFGILPNLQQPPSSVTIEGNALCENETAELIAAH